MREDYGRSRKCNNKCQNKQIKKSNRNNRLNERVLMKANKEINIIFH